jgi:hypothetical protein
MRHRWKLTLHSRPPLEVGQERTWLRAVGQCPKKALTGNNECLLSFRSRRTMEYAI